MSKETRADGRIITGGPTDTKGKVTLSRNEIKELKDQMYQDFLVAKQTGKIGLGADFDTWVRHSVEMLRTGRRSELLAQHNMGQLSDSEFNALEAMRLNVISAIIQMDTTGLDKYGVQYLDANRGTVRADGGMLVPEYRKDKVKFNKGIIKQ